MGKMTLIRRTLGLSDNGGSLTSKYKSGWFSEDEGWQQPVARTSVIKTQAAPALESWGYDRGNEMCALDNISELTSAGLC